MHTNEFFVEQVQNITLTATDGQLVDFLYKLGSGSSMVRVRDLELQPDTVRQHLNANIKLVASYQKKPAAPAKAAAPVNAKPSNKTAK
jgi:Tfp pilus assembly protein PilO